MYGCKQGNYKNLTSLLAEYDEKMQIFIKLSSIAAQYTSWSIQNEIISIILKSILSEIIKIINNSTYWGFFIWWASRQSKKSRFLMMFAIWLQIMSIERFFWDSLKHFPSLKFKALNEIVIEILDKSWLNDSKLSGNMIDALNL